MALDSGKPTLLLSLDINDALDDDHLLNRATEYSGWVTSRLESTSYVCIGNCRTSIVRRATGVSQSSQGLFLGPLVFFLFTLPIVVSYRLCIARKFISVTKCVMFLPILLSRLITDEVSS